MQASTERIELAADSARRVLAVAEDVLARGTGRPIQHTWIATVIRPFLLLGIGLGQLVRPFLVVLAALLTVPLLVHLIGSRLGFATSDLNGVVVAVLIYAIAWAALHRSGEAGLSGYTSAQVRTIARECEFKKDASHLLPTQTLSVLERAETLSMARLATFRWLGGATLAVAAYLAKRGFDTSDGSLIGAAVVPLLVAALVAAFISAYARSMQALFGASQAACHLWATASAHASTRDMDRRRRTQRPRA